MFNCDVVEAFDDVKVVDPIPSGHLDGAGVKIILLDNGKPVFIVADGLVDTAISELGARVVDVTI